MLKRDIGTVCKELRMLRGEFECLSMKCEHLVDTLTDTYGTTTYICNRVGKLCEPNSCPLKPVSKSVLRRVLGR